MQHIFIYYKLEWIDWISMQEDPCDWNRKTRENNRTKLKIKMEKSFAGADGIIYIDFFFSIDVIWILRGVPGI